MLFTNLSFAQNMPRHWIAKLAAVGFVMAAGTGAAMAKCMNMTWGTGGGGCPGAGLHAAAGELDPR